MSADIYCQQCGNQVDVEDCLPTCHMCELVATHYNAKTGEVYEWTNLETHESNLREMHRQMDEAFDNTYFNGGW